MADAKKCDRCGDLYEMYDGIKFAEDGFPYNHIHTLTNHDSVHKTFDLCPTCMNKLIMFLKIESSLYIWDKFAEKYCATCKYCVHEGTCSNPKKCIDFDQWEEAKDDGSN